MIRKLFLFVIISTIAGQYINAQDLSQAKSMVDLRGQTGTTIFTNQTADTLKFSTRTIRNAPYVENNTDLIIPPGNTDSVKISFAYPAFLMELSNDFLFYNAPGKRLNCTIYSLKRGVSRIKFENDLVLENDYYTAYQNHFKGTKQESLDYYKEGGKLTDFNNFPKVADSLNNISLNFLREYKQPLPAYFKLYEEARLNYNAAYRKYNVLFDREFRTGKKIQVTSAYFDFVKSLPGSSDNLILNSSYLNYMGFWIFFSSGQSPSLAKRIALLDKLMEPSELRDAVKMEQMSMQSKSVYDSIFPSLVFHNRVNKYALDSIITLTARLPMAGKPAPRIKLSAINGDTVSLSQFRGKPVIINFWASWCAPCLQEFPNENLLHSKFSAKGLVIINVCVDTDRPKWESLSKVKKLSMVNLYANANEYKRIKATYNIEGLPRSILIGKDGAVVDNYYKSAGQITDKEVEELLYN